MSSHLSSPSRTHLVELILESTGPSSSALENGIIANKVIGLPIAGSSRLPSYTTYSASTLSERNNTLITPKVPSYTTYKSKGSGLEKIIEYGSSISFQERRASSAPAPPSPSSDLKTNKPNLWLRSRTESITETIGSQPSGHHCAPCTQ